MPGAHKTYHQKTPIFILRFLVHVGNLVNNIVTGITVLQVYRSTGDCEKAWVQFKNKLKLKNSSSKKEGADEKKFVFVLGMFHNRWPRYHNHEICQSFYSGANKVRLVDQEGKDTLLWDMLVAWMQTHVDFTHGVMLKHHLFINIFHMIFLRLKPRFPEYILPVIKLTVPTIQPSTFAWFPNGLPNPIMPKISDEMLKLLFEDMQDSEIVRYLRDRCVSKPVTPVKAGSKKKKKKCQR